MRKNYFCIQITRINEPINPAKVKPDKILTHKLLDTNNKTNNNNKFNLLKETVACRLLWETAIICGQVAFFWPTNFCYQFKNLI